MGRDFEPVHLPEQQCVFHSEWYSMHMIIPGESPYVVYEITHKPTRVDEHEPAIARALPPRTCVVVVARSPQQFAEAEQTARDHWVNNNLVDSRTTLHCTEARVIAYVNRIGCVNPIEPQP